MSYAIIREAPYIPPHQSRKSIERVTMEELEVGEGFLVKDYEAHMRCIWARAEMKPMRFSVKKLPTGRGWMVRREE